MRQLEKFGAFLRNYAQNNPVNAYCLDYQDIVEENNKLWGMFDFLGRTPDKRAIKEILLKPHSYAPKSKTMPKSRQEDTIDAEESKASGPAKAPMISVLAGKLRRFSGATPKKLMKRADRYYSQGNSKKASAIYAKIVSKFEKGKLQRLPYRAGIRSGRDVFMVRTLEAHKLAYFPIPKCACTSISHLLYELEHGEKIYRAKKYT